MKPNCDHIPMGFTDETFPAGTHMCLIYNDEKERLNVIEKFIGAGIQVGEKVCYFTDQMLPEYFKNWLAKQGIQGEENESRQQLSIYSSNDAYCPAGIFVPEDMLNKLKTVYLQSREEGFPNVRVSGEMEWAVKGVPGSDRLLEYEAKINNIVAEYPVTAICQYNANQFGGATILNILKVHPLMIVHGQIIQNPYYLSPAEFLSSYKPGSN